MTRMPSSYNGLFVVGQNLNSSCGEQILCSDCVDAQAELSLHYSYSHRSIFFLCNTCICLFEPPLDTDKRNCIWKLLQSSKQILHEHGVTQSCQTNITWAWCYTIMSDKYYMSMMLHNHVRQILHEHDVTQSCQTNITWAWCYTIMSDKYYMSMLLQNHVRQILHEHDVTQSCQTLVKC